MIVNPIVGEGPTGGSGYGTHSSLGGSSSPGAAAESSTVKQAKFASFAATESFQIVSDGSGKALGCFARQIQANEDVTIAAMSGNAAPVYFSTDGNPLTAKSGMKGQVGIGAAAVLPLVVTNLCYLYVYSPNAGEGVIITIRRRDG